MQPLFLAISLTVVSVVIGMPHIPKEILAEIPTETPTANPAGSVPEKIETIGNDFFALSPIVKSLLEDDNKTESLENRITNMEEEIESLRRENICVYHGRRIPFNGSAGATCRNDEKHPAENAFKPQQQGKYPYATEEDNFPATVWFKFNQPQTVKKISIRSRNDVYDDARQAPEDLTFVASDDCSKWVTLSQVEHAGFTKKGEAREFVIPCITAFKCYGITVNKSHRPDLSMGKYVSFADVVMYE